MVFLIATSVLLVVIDKVGTLLNYKFYTIQAYIYTISLKYLISRSISLYLYLSNFL